jgi:hypothetical protein
MAVAATVAVSRAGSGPRAVSFARDIEPIFDRKCTACHPVSYPYLDLRRGHAYDHLVRVSSRTAPAFERVLPGRPELSYLLTHPRDPSLRGLLTHRERDLIAEWIRQGARRN